MRQGVDDGDQRAGLLAGLLRHEGPQRVDVDGVVVVLVAGQVELAHTDLAKVAGVEHVHVDAVVVLATGEPAATRVLSVFPDASVAGRDVAALLAVL